MGNCIFLDEVTTKQMRDQHRPFFFIIIFVGGGVKGRIGLDKRMI